MEKSGIEERKTVDLFTRTFFFSFPEWHDKQLMHAIANMDIINEYIHYIHVIGNQCHVRMLYIGLMAPQKHTQTHTYFGHIGH